MTFDVPVQIWMQLLNISVTVGIFSYFSCQVLAFPDQTAEVRELLDSLTPAQKSRSPPALDL